MGVISPTANKLTQLTASLASSGGPPTPEQGATVAALQGRMLMGARVAAGLLAITVVTMAVARYL
jgi:hypothetical protein